MKTLSCLVLCFILFSCSSKRKENTDAYALLPENSSSQITEESVKNLIKEWPAPSKVAAEEMMNKYKLPQEVTPTRLTWFGNGNFKRSQVHRDGALHQFPLSHFDVLEQVVDYREPFNKVDDLWNFNGSVVLSKTAGEMSVFSQNEEMNIVIFNLAHQVIHDKRSANEARKELTKLVSQGLQGEMDSKMKELNFTPAEKSADPDFITIKNEERKEASAE